VPGKGEYTFLGIAPSRSKYPFVVKNSQGETMFFTSTIATYINQAKEAK